uniref:C2 domain-containing protein n=1 Tax=Macrostomum lignano TaxID=282301 RepID=A0A1I8FEX5_9PLAT
LIIMEQTQAVLVVVLCAFVAVLFILVLSFYTPLCDAGLAAVFKRRRRRSTAPPAAAPASAAPPGASGSADSAHSSSAIVGRSLAVTALTTRMPTIQADADDPLIRDELNDERVATTDWAGFGFSLTYDWTSRQLSVKICEARGLPAMDFPLGTSDPYCKVSILPDKANRVQTKVRSRKLNPTWNEVFLFENFPGERLLDRTLLIQVLDYDRFSRDDPIGDAQFPFSTVLADSLTLWRNLQPNRKTRGFVGELLLALSYNPHFQSAQSGADAGKGSQSDGSKSDLRSLIAWPSWCTARLEEFASDEGAPYTPKSRVRIADSKREASCSSFFGRRRLSQAAHSIALPLFSSLCTRLFKPYTRADPRCRASGGAAAVVEFSDTSSKTDFSMTRSVNGGGSSWRSARTSSQPKPGMECWRNANAAEAAVRVLPHAAAGSQEAMSGRVGSRWRPTGPVWTAAGRRLLGPSWSEWVSAGFWSNAIFSLSLNALEIHGPVSRSRAQARVALQPARAADSRHSTPTAGDRAGRANEWIRGPEQTRQAQRVVGSSTMERANRQQVDLFDGNNCCTMLGPKPANRRR